MTVVVTDIEVNTTIHKIHDHIALILVHSIDKGSLSISIVLFV